MTVPLGAVIFLVPSIRTLHFTWVAFFLTFLVWFNHAPLGAVIKEAFDLSKAQWKALLLLNVALTIPARIFGGEHGWRYALLLTGSITFIYGVIYYRSVRNTPKGSTYFKPKKSGGLEVSGCGGCVPLMTEQPLRGFAVTAKEI